VEGPAFLPEAHPAQRASHEIAQANARSFDFARSAQDDMLLEKKNPEGLSLPEAFRALLSEVYWSSST
jgi:hypothetical protein